MTSDKLRISPAREIARRILARVDSSHIFAINLLQAPEVSALSDADRRLAIELVMGVLRWRGELDHHIRQLSGKALESFDPEVRTILRLGVYQIRFLTRVPKRAAVNEAVKQAKAARKRSAAGLVNAVLRKCDMPASPIGKERDPESLEAALRALPGWLRERWTRQFGAGAASDLAWASTSAARATLRACGITRDELREQLAQEGIVARRAPYASSALTVERGNVHSSRLWREGHIVIQDEASQLVAGLLRPAVGQRVLDLCAAPGIKTAQLAEALETGTLLACDVSPRRLGTMQKLLRERAPRGPSVLFLAQDATLPLAFRETFDRVLLDAPCSGTGTLARNPEIKWRLQPEDLPRLADMQTRMLENALDTLAPGSRLVYATCSLEPEENEEVIEKALARKPGFRSLGKQELSREFPELAALFDDRGYFRTRPDLHDMDGFFAAVLTRCDGGPNL